MIDFTSLQPGTELSSEHGIVLFQRYKPNNFHDQNVQVIRKHSPSSPPIWLKEKHLSLPTPQPKAKLDDDFLIQGHA